MSKFIILISALTVFSPAQAFDWNANEIRFYWGYSSDSFRGCYGYKYGTAYNAANYEIIPLSYKLSPNRYLAVTNAPLFTPYTGGLGLIYQCDEGGGENCKKISQVYLPTCKAPIFYNTAKNKFVQVYDGNYSEFNLEDQHKDWKWISLSNYKIFSNGRTIYSDKYHLMGRVGSIGHENFAAIYDLKNQKMSKLISAGEGYVGYAYRAADIQFIDKNGELAVAGFFANKAAGSFAEQATVKIHNLKGVETRKLKNINDELKKGYPYGLSDNGGSASLLLAIDEASGLLVLGYANGSSIEDGIPLVHKTFYLNIDTDEIVHVE